MSKTLIKSIVHTLENDINSYPSLDNFQDIIYDLDIDLSYRISSFNLLFSSLGQDSSLEHVKKLGLMYIMSNTKLLEEYLLSLILSSSLSNFLKLLLAQYLFLGSNSTGYSTLFSITSSIIYDETITTTSKLESIFLLMQNEDNKKNTLSLFTQLINNTIIDCDFRYKSILSISNPVHNFKKSLSSYFLKNSCISFAHCSSNLTMYRILACQFILQKCKPNNYIKKDIEKLLISIAYDNNLDHNLRADAADVLLHLTSKYGKAKGREIITLLGHIDSLTHTIYDDAQNVHTESIEKSILNIVEFLSQTPTIKTSNGDLLSFDFIKNEIDTYITDNKLDDKTKEKIYLSLNRISIDHSLYTKYNSTLLSILIKTMSYIYSHTHKSEMFKRLIQELIEMSGTCSSGYISRIVNSITGFGDFSLRISFEDQIISNLTGRLNARARNIDDLSFQEKVLEEMQSNIDYRLKTNFHQFFCQEISDIRLEMYNEFKSYISDTDFDLYFMRAICFYESGSY